MKKIKIILFLSGIIIITSFSCEKESKQIDYFPNQVGYNWTYNVFDSVSNKAESLKISIIGNKTINGLNSYIWLLAYSDHSDTFYVSENKDTVKFNSNNSSKRIYIIPFSLNQVWNESYFSSSNSKVISVENVSVEAGNFNEIYVIERNIRSNNYYLYEKIYFKPNVGIIKLYINERDFLPSNIKTWELKNYNL